MIKENKKKRVRLAICDDKTTTQSSTLVAGTTVASKAVDGNAEGSMLNGHSSATNSAQNAWWQTDMGSVQNIDNITVWGRTDCCPEMTTDFYLFVSDVPFTSNDLNTTLNQSGVFNHHYSSYAGPASVPVNRTGRYVRVQLAGTQSLVLGEVQVWGQAAKVNWLVTDQLGTPRMIIDKTGGPAAVSRHDYLPFGEELGLIGGRTTTQGYSEADGVRQKFTQKERDGETGLDYFASRYHASTQGRFTSADTVMGTVTNPQTLNLYAYVQNNPLKFIDPTGHTAVNGMLLTNDANTNRRMEELLGIESPSSGIEEIAPIREDRPVSDTVDPNSADDQPAISWDTAELMSEDDVLRSVPFEGTPYKNTATLLVDHSRAYTTDSNVFTIRVNFTLPEYAKGISSGPTSFVKLPAENRFKFYTAPLKDSSYEFHVEKRSASVTIRLQESDVEAKNSHVIISVRGTYGNGDEFYGQAKVRLVSKADLPRQKMPKIP